MDNWDNFRIRQCTQSIDLWDMFLLLWDCRQYWINDWELLRCDGQIMRNHNFRWWNRYLRRYQKAERTWCISWHSFIRCLPCYGQFESSLHSFTDFKKAVLGTRWRRILQNLLEWNCIAKGKITVKICQIWINFKQILYI